MSDMAKEAGRLRRGALITLALANPEGLTKYQYTKGMTKDDSMKFWTDAEKLGFVKLGVNERGTNLFGYRSTVVS